MTRKQKNIKKINYKLSNGCKVCGYRTYHGALDLHHIKEGTRGFNHLSKMESLDDISFDMELKKCIVLCKVHHAEVHAGMHKQYLIKKEEQTWV